MRILQLASVMLFALVAGVFWGTWFSLSRSIAEISPATFLEVGKIMIGNLGGPMSILFPAAIVSAMPLLYVLYRRRQSAPFVLAAAAIALMVGAMTITLVVNVPLDFEFAEWTLATLPPDWRAIRDRWEFYHGMRTLLSVIALCSLVASILASRAPGGSTHAARRAA